MFGSPSAVLGSLHFVFPARFERRDFSSCSFAVTGVRSGACVRGVVVASYRLKPNPELGAAGASFRPNGVAFEVYRAPRQQPCIVAPTVRLPLSLADFHTVGEGMQRTKQQRELFFRAKAANYWAIAWLGKGAAKSDRAALASLVAFIRVK